MTQYQTNITAAQTSTHCVPWVVFASGQGSRDEYGTIASTGIGAAQEAEISALCRDFHNSLGVQEVPREALAVLFWKSRQTPFWFLTQVLRAPQTQSQRIAYEYFTLALDADDLLNFIGNPLRVLEWVDLEELRERRRANLREPLCFSVLQPSTNGFVNSDALSFAQNGECPATRANFEKLAAFLEISIFEQQPKSFATWWPEAHPPRAGLFDIVLRATGTWVSSPREILALAAELNQSLSRNLPAPPNYDANSGRVYRLLLHSTEDVQTMLREAYLPTALEESPHRWLMRPQKAAGLCQKIADDLPDYISRLPAHYNEGIAEDCRIFAERYQNLAHTLQKLHHPNILHQNRNFATRSDTSVTPTERFPKPVSTSRDSLFAPPERPKSGQAMDSAASKIGALLLLLTISSVAAVGLILPEENSLKSTSKTTLPSRNSSTNFAGQAYDLAAEMARVRVKTVAGLTRQQRLAAGREALAQLMGGDTVHMTPDEITKLAKQAPESVRKSAFRGVKSGENTGIREQNQRLQQ